MQARSDSALELRKALGQFATGVTVVTTRAADGSPVGLTVNSFTSVSLEPPLMLWWLGRDAASFDAFRLAERHLINVLAAEQLDIARRFATRGGDKFAGVQWTATDTGLPRLAGCIAWFECAIRSRYEKGDHLILGAGRRGVPKGCSRPEAVSSPGAKLRQRDREASYRENHRLYQRRGPSWGMTAGRIWENSRNKGGSGSSLRANRD